MWFFWKNLFNKRPSSKMFRQLLDCIRTTDKFHINKRLRIRDASLATGSQAPEMWHSKEMARVHSSSIEILRHKVWQVRILESQQVLGTVRIYSRFWSIVSRHSALAITHVISCSASSPIQAVNHRELAVLARASRETRCSCSKLTTFAHPTVHPQWRDL